MIRINLLPVRAAKKRESVRFQLTVAGLATFLVFAVSVGVYLTVRSEANSVTAQIESGNHELDALKVKIGELSKIKEQKRIVEDKLNIIKTLEAARTGPTKLFKAISESVPEKAWIASIKDDGALITLKGYASDDEVVADFMRGLQKHGELGGVELDVAQRVVEKETGSDVVGFTIRLEKVVEKPVEKPKEK
ncbi:MAG: PilN domain-containing protein [Deltaproteobacteria bacterium]|nr:PilN domain-containing protein [Deltaproteobacteria bacterium]